MTDTTATAPIRTALVGYGYWGRNLARNLQAAKGTQLVAVAESDSDARAAVKQLMPSVRTYATFEELLDQPDIEALVLATPAVRHADMVTWGLESGRHVLVEKPLAMTVDDAEHLVKLSDRVGRVLMVGHTFLYSAPVRRLARYLDEGELGEVQYLYSQRLSLGKIRRDCNALWNFGPHDISIMLYLLRERPVEVSARSFSFIGEGVDDVCFGSMTFESGVAGNFQCSWIDPRKVRLMTVVGNRKMAIYDDVSPDQKLHLVDAGVAPSRDRSLGAYESLGDFQWRTRVGDILIPNIPLTEPLLNEIEAFADACRTGVPPVADARHGADVVRILSALEESAGRLGASVQVEW
jgi:predicted dehydrogenase